MNPFPMNPNPVVEPYSLSNKKEEEKVNEKSKFENTDKKQNERLNEQLINYDLTYDKGHPVIPQNQLPPEIQRAKLD